MALRILDLNLDTKDADRAAHAQPAVEHRPVRAPDHAGAAARRYRQGQGHSLSEIARRLNIGKASVHRIVHGAASLAQATPSTKHKPRVRLTA
jgi:DNA invertase Pin-like site-specific DNA recombinase